MRQDFFAEVTELLLDGFRVNTQGVNFGLSISGNFDGPTDQFEAGRHQAQITASPGAQLRQVIPNRLRLEKRETNKRLPSLLQFVDVSTQQEDGPLTPGGLAQLGGHRLRFDPADPAQGIFFMAAGGTASRVEVVARNRPGELIFQAPGGLAAGSYTVEVRAALAEGDVRTGQLEAELTVA